MSKNFVINLEIYPVSVMVSIGETNEQLLGALNFYKLKKSELKNYKKPFKDNWAGRATMFSNNLGLIRLRDDITCLKDYDTLAHEIFHMVTFIFDVLDTPFALYTTAEPYAYLIGFLTYKIYSKINKNKSLKC